MKHYFKFVIPALICIVVVFITFYMIFDIKSKVEDTYYNSDNILEEQNYTDNSEENLTIEQNNTNIDNDIKNKVTSNDSTQSQTESPISDQNDEEGTTDKKQQAIDLVKAEWGEDNTMSFRCDSVTSNGEYIIAVISKSSATVKNYFKVNLTNKTVEIYY